MSHVEHDIDIELEANATTDLPIRCTAVALTDAGTAVLQVAMQTHLSIQESVAVNLSKEGLHALIDRLSPSIENQLDLTRMRIYAAGFAMPSSRFPLRVKTASSTARPQAGNSTVGSVYAEVKRENEIRRLGGEVEDLKAQLANLRSITTSRSAGREDITEIREWIKATEPQLKIQSSQIAEKLEALSSSNSIIVPIVTSLQGRLADLETRISQIGERVRMNSEASVNEVATMKLSLLKMIDQAIESKVAASLAATTASPIAEATASLNRDVMERHLDELLSRVSTKLEQAWGANRDNKVPSLQEFFRENQLLWKAAQYFNSHQPRLTDKGTLDLLIGQYTLHIMMLWQSNPQTSGEPRAESGEDRLVRLFSSLGAESSKNTQEAWEFVQKPYSPLIDLEVLASHFRKEIQEEGRAHPACQFANACGYEFFIPTVGKRPEFTQVDVQAERTEPGALRGTIAEVLVPGTRSLKQERIVQKAKVIIST